MEVVNESIYDHPRYYDLVFGADCAAELRFIESVNQKYLGGGAKRLFEPACGTGRLMYGLAKRGYEVAGIDLNPKAVAYNNDRFKRHQLTQAARVADMADFRCQHKWDLAFNTVNSFRHLTSHQAALDHLICMARGTRKGGIYLIGFDLVPTVGQPMDEESWSARRGHLAVLTHMWTIERNRKSRLERFGIHFDIYTPSRQFRITDELKMRSYTKKQFQNLVDQSKQWEIVDAYDFAYEIDNPIEVDASTEDVVYLLKKK